MNKKLFFLLLVFVSLCSYSQKTNRSISQIKQELSKKVLADTSRIQLTIDLAKLYENKSRDSSLYFYQKALELAKINKLEPYAADIYLSFGRLYYKNFEFGRAIKEFEKSHKIFASLGNLKKIALLYNEIGYCYHQLLSEEKAIQYYFKSLDVYESNLKDQEGVARNLMDIGNIFYGNENFEFANNYFNKSLKIYRELKDDEGIAVSYINLGNSISESGNHELGLKYYLKSIEISKKLKDELSIAINYNNIADSYISLENYSLAISYLNKALKIAKDLKDVEFIGLIQMNFAEIYLKQGRYNESIAKAHSSIKITKTTKNIEYQADNLLFLSKSYEKIGELDVSLKYLKEYQELKDSITKIDKTKKVALFKALNDLELNRITINELSAKNELSQLKYENEKKVTYLLIVLIVLFTIFLIIYINLLASRKKAYNLLEYKNHLVNSMNEEMHEQSVRLEELNSTKDKFLSIIAHDLKNPFNSIIGFSELLIENFNDYNEDKKLKFLRIIKESSKKASNLLSNLLLWANNQSGNLKFDPKKMDVSLIVSDVITLLEIQAINKGISISNEVESKLFCNVDENMMNTVFRNLVSNAIKFTFEKGEINLYSRVVNGFVEICIKDNGTGITKEDQASLFDIDVKNSSVGTANEQGSGLGLILCKDFIEKHGGKIWIDSSVTKGSKFWVSLPISN